MTATSATENAALASAGRVVRFQVYRYDPDKDARPYMQNLEVRLAPTDKMLLDALMRIKSDVDDSLAFRRSCREGVCGSDARNINGKNGLAYITNLAGARATAFAVFVLLAWHGTAPPALGQTEIAPTVHNLTPDGPGQLKETRPTGLCVYVIRRTTPTPRRRCGIATCRPCPTSSMRVVRWPLR